MKKIAFISFIIFATSSFAQIFGGGAGGGYARGTKAFGELPIELISFTGKCEKGINILKWSTASETNNNFFTIESSEDGINWIIVGFVAGAGNSSSKIDYVYTDENTNVNNNYYRLKQTDFDGKYEYSKIIYFNDCKNNETTLSIYPNPSNGIINLSISGDLSSLQTIEVINTLGQIVFISHSFENTINLLNELSGTYIIRIITNSEVIKEKIIISR